MPLLNESEYRKTFGKTMKRLDADGNAPFPFWSYFDQIPQDDFRGYDCSDGSVQYVWRDEDGRFEHILVDTKTDKDVFMTIVLDLINKQVIGHRLMDFKSEYGLRES
jgi:hypothetical protein